MAGKGNVKEPLPQIRLLRPIILRRQMKAVLQCLVSEDIQHGPLADELVKTFSVTLGFNGGLSFADYGTAVTAALKMVVTKSDASNHSNVILLPAMAPAIYVRAAEQCSLKPLLIDSDPDSAMLSRKSIDELMKEKPVAIVVCHGLGQLESIRSLRDLGLPIIEDVSSVLFNLPPKRQATRNRHVSGVKREAHDKQLERHRLHVKDKSTGQETDVVVESLGIDSHPKTSDSRDDTVWPLPPYLGCDSDVVILGLARNSALMAGGGGVALVRNRTNERLLKSISYLCGWSGLSDMNAALALAQQYELPNSRKRCLHLSQWFREALSRSRHRTIDSGPIAQLFFPVLVRDGMQLVRRYASRHRIETQMAVQGTALSDEPPFMGEISTVDSLFKITIGSELGLDKSGVAKEDFTVAIKDYLVGTQEIARRCLLFPLYPSLTDSDANRIARVLATLP